MAKLIELYVYSMMTLVSWVHLQEGPLVIVE